jgi:hypothetical protein
MCIECCQLIGRNDFLFGEIFDKFKTAQVEGIFLELLEPFLLQDKLKSLNPEIMQLFVEHYREHNMLLRVEQCILHLDIASLDFHQVSGTIVPHLTV